MTLSSPEQQKKLLITQNRHDFQDIYNRLKLISPDQTDAAEQLRQELLHAMMANGAINGCRGSKPYSHQLSPGCRLCVESSWSCLFINGRCNCSCFYCPSSQDDIGEPMTNNLTFPTASSYLAYLKHFGFRGFSLSGGEPLLTLERSLDYLLTVKKHFGDKIHSWIYTNGSLITHDILARLRDCGLDEIRFDIGALNYALDKSICAVGMIPVVTIEIPAVPEEKTNLKKKLKQMADAGINYLNLHQLRLTKYNYRHFKNRPYTYLHGEKLTVLESELTALELIRDAQNEGLDLPINYCSFIYKNCYQKAAARTRGAADMGKSHEQLTAAGYLRSCSILAEPQRVQAIAAQFNAHDADLWTISPGGNQLYFAAPLWHQVTMGGLPVQIDYAQTRTSSSVSYRYPFREIKLPSGRNIVIERSQAATFTLSAEQAANFFNHFMLINFSADTVMEQTTIWPRELLPYEQLPAGLQAYF